MAKQCPKCRGNRIAYAGWFVAVYRFYCLDCGEWQSSIFPPNKREIDLGKADRNPKRNPAPPETDDKPE